MTPITDLNLSKAEIHPALISAVTDPYAIDGLTECPAIQAAISISTQRSVRTWTWPPAGPIA